jgi:membrane fusion protein (multidrug efflux system)
LVKRAIIIAVGLVLALGAYLLISGGPRTSPPTRTAAPPPPEVGIVTVQPGEVAFPIEYAGRVVGFRDVEVRALVGGILLKRGFEEGARVTQDQLLFQIDPAPYKVALSRRSPKALSPSRVPWSTSRSISAVPTNSRNTSGCREETHFSISVFQIECG